MNQSFKDYIEGEKGLTLEALHSESEELILCADIWGFLENDFLGSVDNQCLIFIYFLQQARISLHLSITSLMQLHLVQSNQNLRYVLENMAICIYYLNSPEEVNEIMAKTDEKDAAEVVEKIKIKAYKFLEEKYKNISDIIKRYKSYANDYGAHLSLASMGMNTKIALDGKKVEVSFFDDAPTLLLKNRYLTIADIMCGFCEAIMKQRMDKNMLPLKEGVEAKIKEFYSRTARLKKKYVADRAKSK